MFSSGRSFRTDSGSSVPRVEVRIHKDNTPQTCLVRGSPVVHSTRDSGAGTPVDVVDLQGYGGRDVPEGTRESISNNCVVSRVEGAGNKRRCRR